MAKDKTPREKHPSAFEPSTLILNIALSVFGAIIGMQLITSLGVTPSTSIIGAIAAMLIARIPMEIFSKYRSIHRQNLVQTSISSATFGAANSLLIPIGIPFAMGHQELIVPMLIGAGLAMFVDTALLYKLFGSKVFPATGTVGTRCCYCGSDYCRRQRRQAWIAFGRRHSDWFARLVSWNLHVRIWCCVYREHLGIGYVWGWAFAPSILYATL